MHSATRQSPSVVALSAAFVGLLVLLGLTLAAAQLELGSWNFIVAVLIATAKAIVIVLVFMQVKDSTPLIRLFAFAAAFWLAILLALTAADYFTRT